MSDFQLCLVSQSPSQSLVMFCQFFFSFTFSVYCVYFGASLFYCLLFSDSHPLYYKVGLVTWQGTFRYTLVFSVSQRWLTSHLGLIFALYLVQKQVVFKTQQQLLKKLITIQNRDYVFMNVAVV